MRAADVICRACIVIAAVGAFVLLGLYAWTSALLWLAR